LDEQDKNVDWPRLLWFALKFLRQSQELRGLEELEGGGVWELAGKPVTFNWGIRG
jgi:hypothetical protein